MSMSLISLCSGSDGNATLLECGGQRVLVDAGLSGNMLSGLLKENGVEPDTLSAILITHEHIDHVKGAGIMSRRYKVPIYANALTFAGMGRAMGELPAGCRREIMTGEDFYLDGISVTPFPLSHDAADPVGYIFDYLGQRAAIATDLGHASTKFIDRVSGCALILLEANHDEGMLRRNGRYSESLKKRILGRRGHLSNAGCADALIKLHRAGVRQALLGHLSMENNTPELAFQTVRDILLDSDIVIGRDMTVGMTYRDHSARRVSVT